MVEWVPLLRPTKVSQSLSTPFLPTDRTNASLYTQDATHCRFLLVGSPKVQGVKRKNT